MVSPSPRPFLREVVPSRDGLVGADALPSSLPYGLQPRHLLRTVEDVQQLIHQLNTVLHESNYEPLEDLLDRAAFSGLISRTVASRLAAASQILVVNRYHNGYPDLIRTGEYPHDAVQRGTGLEIKASRSEGSWQSHGPRPGWFCVVQFELDERADVARLDREPTRIRAAMLAELDEDDWSWTPARSGRIRSGTASITQAGKLKLRAGAVWVDPEYRARHEALIASLRTAEFRRAAPELVSRVLAVRDEPATAREIAAALSQEADLSLEQTLSAVRSTITKLRQSGRVASGERRGTYLLQDPADLRDS